MLKKITLASIIVAALTGTALAQLPMPGISLQKEKRTLTPEEIAKQKAIDDAYKAANSKIPDEQKANDPWADVRPAPNPPPAPKKSAMAKQSTAVKQSAAPKSNQQ